MIDLDAIAPEILLARGQYSTVRAAHEDELKALQVACGNLAAIPAQVLRRMQPDQGEPQSVSDLIAAARKAVDEMEAKVGQVEALAQQKAELRPIAWAK